MKKLSIKWKVTIWYAGMLLLMAAGISGFLLKVSDRMARSESVSTLKNQVWDFIEELEVEDGGFEWDEELRFYENGVTFSLYDDEGRLLAGGLPEEFPENTILKAYKIQDFSGRSGKWTTYDAAVPCEEDRVLWVRGVYGPDSLDFLEGIFPKLLIVGFPLLALLALLVGYLITWRALLPVEMIRKTAEEIGGGNDLSQRLPAEKAQGEIRRLADTFNHMFERLESSFERERQFTSDASHELRTPVAVILSEAEYALLPDATREEQEEGLQVICQQARRMGALISELLFLARADHGTQGLKKEPVELRELLWQAVSGIQDEAGKKQIKIRLEKNGPGLLVQGDQGALGRAFGNLLENAVQYGREGGFIHISLESVSGRAVCRIEDNGIGIAPEHLERIWERFYRADQARGTQKGNSGLGLAIVRWIVESHGGSVQALSREGEGSCFTVSLPLEQEIPDS